MLGIDTKIVQQWCLKGSFSKDSTEWLDDVSANGNIVVEPDTFQKRKAGVLSTESAESPHKKPKDDSCTVTIDSSSITHTLLTEAKMSGTPKDAGFVQVRTGHNIYIVNKAASDHKFPSGFFVCGFGKGSFKIIKDENGTPWGTVSARLVR